MLTKFNSLSFWLNYIEKLQKKRVFSLKNIKKIASKLQLLPVNAYVFTVSGTNGKGTTCTVLENIFLKEGYKVGLYTSPHLIHYKERIKINGHYLKDNLHINAFCLIESVRDNIPLTYFEFITLSALILFKEKYLDILILEVGLGGRLDATNIVDSDISIITNIGLDHTELLGTTRESIGKEKAGIFRKKK